MKSLPNYLCLLVCAAFCVACGGGDYSPPSDTNSTIPGGGIGTAIGAILIQPEVEPNDSISMAQPVSIPSPSATVDYVGFQVNGTINNLADGADTFSFTASRTRVFSIRLCDSSCPLVFQGGSLDVAMAYFDVLDQTGNVLLSSQGDNTAGNYREINIDAGVLYYIMVLAEDTMNAAQNYSLIAHEKITF